MSKMSDQSLCGSSIIKEPVSAPKKTWQKPTKRKIDPKDLPAAVLRELTELAANRPNPKSKSH
jgi:hypothetical protein